MRRRQLAVLVRQLEHVVRPRESAVAWGQLPAIRETLSRLLLTVRAIRVEGLFRALPPLPGRLPAAHRYRRKADVAHALLLDLPDEVDEPRAVADLLVAEQHTIDVDRLARVVVANDREAGAAVFWNRHVAQHDRVTFALICDVVRDVLLPRRHAWLRTAPTRTDDCDEREREKRNRSGECGVVHEAD